MRELAERSGRVERVNIGGLHHRAGRTEHLRYVFLAPDDVASLRELQHGGIEVTAQDVPSAPPVPLATVLATHGAA
jgi:PTS system mannose-specific IIB component/fructoselysine and glucoselysine-specific PTS system IIB component